MAKRHVHRSGDPASLFRRLEELVLANSVADEFEEVFKLIVAKLRDERSNSPGRFRACADPDQTYDQIVDLLRDADHAWPGLLDNVDTALAPSQLQVCVEALSDHAISETSLEVMDGLFEHLVARNAKGAKGQFFTPRHVVELCVRMLDPKEGEIVLDPACGSGGFLLHAMNHVRAHHASAPRGRKPGDALEADGSSKLWGYDLDARAVRVAKALMLLSGGPQANIIRLDSLNRPGPNAQTGTALTADAGTIESAWDGEIDRRGGFDVILTNPPFAGDVRSRTVLDRYDLSRGRSRIERDVLFLERCIELLRPDGRMAIVLPHNKLAAAVWAYARHWLLDRARVLAVVGLGRNTFLPHTHQKASVLFVRKNAAPRTAAPAEPIFFAISEKDGKDSKGRPVVRSGADVAASAWQRLDHDLGHIAEAFDAFRQDQRHRAEAS
jgi:type I restriction enzyme M protein